MLSNYKRLLKENTSLTSIGRYVSVFNRFFENSMISTDCEHPFNVINLLPEHLKILTDEGKMDYLLPL